MGNVRIPIISGGGAVSVSIIEEKLEITNEHVIPLERNSYSGGNDFLVFDLPQGINKSDIKFCILEALQDIQLVASGVAFGVGLTTYNATYNTSNCRVMTYGIHSSGEQILYPFVTNFAPSTNYKHNGRCYIQGETNQLLFNPSLQYQLRIYT